MRFGNWETRALLLSSLLILDLGLVILLSRRSDVTYGQDFQVNSLRWVPDSESGEFLEYLFCLPLKGEFELFANRTEIELDTLNEELLTYFQSEKFKQERKEKLQPYLNDRYGIDPGELRYLQSSHKFESLILEQLKMSNYYIMNEKICFVTRESHSEFRYKASKLSKFFLNESLFAYRRATQDLYEMSSPDQTFDQVVMLNREQPYSNCAQNYSRFRCLNECFRERKRLSKYFYDGNETGSIVLDWTDEEQSIRERENFCHDDCEDESCKSTYLLPTASRDNPKTITYTASPLIAKFDFWLQLISLLLPVVAISFFQFSTKLIDSRAFKVVLFFTCLLCGLLVCFALYRQSYPAVDDCEPRAPTKKAISFRLLEPEPFSLIICVGIGNIILGDYRFLGIGRSIYQNKTFAELELETEKGFNETVESVYLQFLDRTSEVVWRLSPRVLFSQDYQTLSRCFQIDVHPREPAYQSMLGITRLTVKFKHRQYLIRQVPNNTSPNGQNLQLKSVSEPKSYERFEEHSSAGDCLDYPKFYPDCGSQQSCVQACVGRMLLDSSGRIAKWSIIDKAHYNASQWNETKIGGFVEQIPKRIKNLCRSKFNQSDCISTAFGKEISTKGLQRAWRTEEINVYYDLLKIFEENDLSSSSLLSSLLIVQSIFLALNLLRLAAVVGFLKFKVRKIKLLHGLIYAVCLIALFVHLICAFRAAMNVEPVLSQHYESPSSMQMSDAVFCFEPKKPDEGNSSLATTNSTANRTDSDLRDKVNLRLIIREEEMETENENTTESLEISKVSSPNATVDLGDSNENGLEYNRTEIGTANETEQASTNYTDIELATDYNVTDKALNSFNSSFNSSLSNSHLTDDYNLPVDDANRLTGALLEEWTSDLTPEAIFDKISYLDKSSGKWITLDVSSGNYTNPDLQIDSFFYQSRKCFSLSSNFDYHRQQLAYLQPQNIDVLKVLFSESFKMEQNLTLSIATKQNSKMQFDSLFDGLYFKVHIEKIRKVFSKVYAISQRELVQLSYKDYFYWVNPLVFIFEGKPELSSYFTRLRDAFKTKYQSATLSLPLQKEDFNLNINDTLFERFYEEYVRENGPPIDREHPEMEFAVNEMELNYKFPAPMAKHPNYDVKFSLAFLKKVVKQSNAGAYLEFVAYLLNALLVLVVIGLFDLLIHQIA